MDCLWQKKETQHDSETGKSSLEPKYIPPSSEGDNDTTEEWTKSWPDQSPAEEPAQSGCTVSGTIDVADAATTDDEETRALKGSQDAENEKGSQVGSKSTSDAEAEEEDRGVDLGPSSSIHLTNWPPEHRGQTHKEHVERVAEIDDSTIGVESGSNLWNSGEYGC